MVKEILKELARKYPKQKSTLLLFSGGLDTSFILHAFSNKLGWKVYTLFIDLGLSKSKVAEIERRAYQLGSKKHFTINATNEFTEDYCALSIKANGSYYGTHPLCSSLSRPLFARIAKVITKKYKIDSIMHGSNISQNNFVRYKRCLQDLESVKEIVPLKESPSREELVNYLKSNNVILDKLSLFSSDENIWGREVEDSHLHDPSWLTPEYIYKSTCSIENSKNISSIVNIKFKNGLPVSLNGEALPLSKLINSLNLLGSLNGVGRHDALEDRPLQNKEREIHESPAATILIKAHKDLEISLLKRNELLLKSITDLKWAYLVYQGYWYNPKKLTLDKKIIELNNKINGIVKVKLYKGNCIILGRKLV